MTVTEKHWHHSVSYRIFLDFFLYKLNQFSWQVSLGNMNPQWRVSVPAGTSEFSALSSCRLQWKHSPHKLPVMLECVVKNQRILHSNVSLEANIYTHAASRPFSYQSVVWSWGLMGVLSLNGRFNKLINRVCVCMCVCQGRYPALSWS